MKISKVVWYILGGLVLIGLGFALGFFVPFRAAAFGLHPMMTLGRLRGGFDFGFPFMGLRAVFGLVWCLGPLAGITALIIVLTRRPAASPAPAAPSAPAAPAAKTESDAQPTAASSKTSAKEKSK